MKLTLVDTSVWRRFFSGIAAVKQLAELLDEDAVLIHPFIVGELVLGGLSREQEGLFARLPLATVVPHDDVLELVRRRHLVRRGIGWVDAHLLASALASSAVLWAVDADLSSAAADLSIAFPRNRL